MRALIVIAALCLACNSAPVDKKAEIIDLLTTVKDEATTLATDLFREGESIVKQKLSQAKAFGPEAVNCVSAKAQDFIETVHNCARDLYNFKDMMDIAISYVKNESFSDTKLEEIMKKYDIYMGSVFPKVLNDASNQATAVRLAFAGQAYKCMHK